MDCFEICVGFLDRLHGFVDVLTGYGETLT